MNDEQLAALTGEERKVLDDPWCSPIIQTILTALADARLEIAKRKQGLKDSTEAWEAEVARLTEERREKEITIDALRDRGDEYRDECDQRREEIARLTEDRDLAIVHDRQPYPTADAYERVCVAAHQRREDIWRLVEAADIALTWMPENDRRRMLVTLLAEMKARYG